MATLARGHKKVQIVRDLAPPDLMTDEALEAELQALLDLEAIDARRWACDRPDCDGLPHQGWLHKHARASQRPPARWWTEWLLMTGRGWGKTRTAAETVKVWAQEPNLQIAVIAKNETLVREICFDSPKSGLLAVLDPADVVRYNSSRGSLSITLRNGTIIHGFGAEVPDNLRGWAFDKAWCDEYAAWKRQTAQATYDMLWFCMREAESPQVIISTTPKPLPHVKKLLTKRDAQVAAAAKGGPHPDVVVIEGHTMENRANLSGIAMAKITSDHEGTRLGEQELAGRMLEDVEGALWQGWMFEWDDFRIPVGSPLVPHMDRRVVAVDPATTSGENADNTGFTVAGRSYSFDATWRDGKPRGYVMSAEQRNVTPEAAMRHAATLYHDWECDAVVVEANNGGEYLSTVMHLVDPTVPVRIVYATRNKRARAAPVAALYEQERVHHVGSPKRFADLEDQQRTYVGLDGTEASPDLLDSLVWALWDLLLDPNTPRPDLAVADDRLRGRGR